MSNIIELTTANFDKMLEAHPLLLIDFWAPWCAPCKVFAQIIKQVAVHYPDVVFGSLNIEEQKELAQEFDVKSIPRVMILSHRTVVYDDSGVLSVDSLRELLDSARAM